MKGEQASVWRRGVTSAAAFLAVSAFALAGVTPSSGAPEALGGVILQEVRPRIITPNGDAKNDVVFFVFDNSVAGVPIEANIRDIRGAHVSGMELNNAEDALMWDGRDEDGRTMPSGVYIYTIKIGESTATGTVVVSR